MEIRSRSAFAALMLLATGCDTRFFLDGKVRTAAAPDGLEGAEVVMSCGGEARLLGKTDATGRLAYGSIPAASPNCVLTVRKEGLVQKSFRVGDVCTSHFVRSCLDAKFVTELAPES